MSNDEHWSGFGGLPSDRKSSPLPETMIQSGLQIGPSGQFELREELGRGGFGLVWSAVDRDRATGGQSGVVALKFLPPEIRHQAEAEADFRREYQRVADLHHGHICPLYHLGWDDRFGLFHVMKLLQGDSLRQQLQRYPDGMPADDAMLLLEQAAKALDYAHQMGVIHRDIKPENMMMTAAPHGLQVIDFGLAAEVRSSLSRYSRTSTGTSGTEAYMAPEQWQGRPQDARCDQWALAIVAWELLTGKLPFSGAGMQLGFAICQANLPDLPASVQCCQNIFSVALAKDPQQRLTDCQALVRALRDGLAKGGSPTPGGNPSPVAPEPLGFPAEAAEVQRVQQSWSEYLQIPVQQTLEDQPLVLIPPGEFMMGSAQSAAELTQIFQRFEPQQDWFESEHPRHTVRLSRPMLVGRGPVTLGQFRRFVNATGYVTEAERDGKGGWGYDPDSSENLFLQDPRFHWGRSGWDQSEQHPVVNVTWHDATAYLDYLNGQGLAGRRFRLLTEAEWEYCCRAGTATFFSNGNDPEDLVKIGNCVDGTFDAQWPNNTAIRGHSGFLFTSPVASFAANAFGLSDMHGNVLEWCGDWYDGDYDSSSPVEDPQGASSGSSRVLRGGSWDLNALNCRSAIRGYGEPSIRNYSVGFRVLCELS